MYFGLIVPACKWIPSSNRILSNTDYLSDSYAYFSTAIIQTLHHTPVKTQLLSVPPWVASGVFSMIVATISDRLRHRYTFVMISIAIMLVGYIILVVVHDNTRLQYAALFLAAAGNYAAMPLVICWFNSNRELCDITAIGSFR